MSGDPENAFGRHPELVEYGLYARQLAPFIDTYGLDSICLTSLERLERHPQVELERVCAHVGLRSRPVWQENIGMQNVSAQRIRKLPLHGLLVTNPVATSLRRALVPKGVRERIRRARSYGARPQLSADLHARLYERFAPDQAELARLFPELGLKPAGFKEEKMA